MEVLLLLNTSLELRVGGTFSKGEPDVGLAPSFEIYSSGLIQGSPLDLIEWAEAQHGYALTKLNELCIEQANDKQ